MATILTIWLFVKLWKKAIVLSDKLPARVWDTLVIVSVFLFALSILAFIDSQRMWNGSTAFTPTNNAGVCSFLIGIDNYDDHGWSHSFTPLSGVYDLNLAKHVLSLSTRRTSVLLLSDLSDDFTLDTHNYPIIHISSHFSFSSPSGWFGIVAHETLENRASKNLKWITTPPPAPVNKQEPGRDALFWILLFNAVATGLSTVSTVILAWISHRRLQAELLLKKYEAQLKLRELEIKEAEAKVRLRDMELKLKQYEEELEKSKSNTLVILTN